MYDTTPNVAQRAAERQPPRCRPLFRHHAALDKSIDCPASRSAVASVVRVHSSKRARPCVVVVYQRVVVVYQHQITVPLLGRGKQGKSSPANFLRDRALIRPSLPADWHLVLTHQQRQTDGMWYQHHYRIPMHVLSQGLVRETLGMLMFKVPASSIATGLIRASKAAS